MYVRRTIRFIHTFFLFKFQPKLFNGDNLNKYNSYGKWISGCGKYFLFSANKVYKITWLIVHLINYGYQKLLFSGEMDSST
jgi:hypothetical protein